MKIRRHEGLGMQDRVGIVEDAVVVGIATGAVFTRALTLESAVSSKRRKECWCLDQWVERFEEKRFGLEVDPSGHACFAALDPHCTPVSHRQVQRRSTLLQWGNMFGLSRDNCQNLTSRGEESDAMRGEAGRWGPAPRSASQALLFGGW